MPVITVKTYSNGILTKTVSNEVTQEHCDKVNAFFAEASRRKKERHAEIREKYKDKFKELMPEKH